jgi:prepilin-type N-terminal cleavage/methylation domain-containing protein
MTRTILKKRGFTLIEILVVVGLLSMILVLSPIFDINQLRLASYEEEIKNITLLLNTARIKSLNNTSQSKHGVYLNTTEYILFEGDSFLESDPSKHVYVKNEHKISYGTSSLNEVIFNQLDGKVENPGKIEIVDPETNVVSIIQINYEGQINW